MAKKGKPVISKKAIDVVKSNWLARCRWELKSVWEARLVAIVASKIKGEDRKSTEFKEYRIPLTEIIGKDYGTTDLEQFKKGIKNVMRRLIEIHESSHIEIIYTTFTKCKINAKKGYVDVSFHPDLAAHYLDLHKHFTQYSLAEFMALSGIHTQRLFEILQSWNDGRDYIEISVDDLCFMLNLPDSYKKDFGNIRRNVLEKAYRDISERQGSSLWFDFQQVKGAHGKTVAVRFVFNIEMSREYARLKRQEQKGDEYLHQRKSNQCFERLRKKGVKDCLPKLNTHKCQYCTTRGRKYAQTIVAKQQPLFTADADVGADIDRRVVEHALEQKNPPLLADTRLLKSIRPRKA